jgi:hypothetical protein
MEMENDNGFSRLTHHLIIPLPEAVVREPERTDVIEDAVTASS